MLYQSLKLPGNRCKIIIYQYNLKKPSENRRPLPNHYYENLLIIFSQLLCQSLLPWHNTGSCADAGDKNRRAETITFLCLYYLQHGSQPFITDPIKLCLQTVLAFCC